jgi:1-deoxy-D-xylulose-5-phosphate synthase
MSNQEYPLLFTINSPEDMRKLSINELKTLSREVREYMVDVISKVGGHFGAGLGTVELAVVLHYVFNTPEDKIVWDVGHQAYPHKILTGRRDRLHTIRQLNGLSGFLKRSESEYDVFGAGHASTALSAALGIATARDYDKGKYRVVAVVGDGAMTGGMAYEAMNNAGLLKKNVIVVLNDNRMSIAPNVWAISNYFNEIITSKPFNRIKTNVWELTGKLDTFGDRIRKVASRLEGGIKSIITPGMLFEALGFRYFGPFNGHNIPQMVKIFSEVKELSGPILIHTITQKGKGYSPAEQDGQNLHGVTPFDKITGVAVKKKDAPPAYTTIFGNALVEIAQQNPKVIGITAAMPDGTGLNIMQKEIPERFYDVGIAEQHAVTFAAGMATEGYTPVAAIYSSFLQRAFDQIIHDVAIQNLPVVFVLDRAGLVGADGPTHHGAFDLSYLRLIPGMVIMAPKDEAELRDMLYTATEYRKGPIALRYPRGNAIGVPMKESFEKIGIGTAEIVRRGEDVAILAVGNMVMHSLKAADLLQQNGILAEVINARFVKPLDEELLRELATRFTHIVTVEDNSIVGGFGSAVAEFFAQNGLRKVYLRIHGIPDTFIEHGKPNELHEMIGIDPEGIAQVVAMHLTTDTEKTERAVKLV